MSSPGNSINEVTTGITGFTGTAFVGSPATQYNVQVGGGTTSTLNSVAPSATAGVPLISAGSSADPSFGTAVVAGGGTGNTTFTAYSVITAGTTATGAFQNVSGVGTSGQILTSNGAAALPTWQTAAGGGGALVWISSHTASDDASIDITSGITSTYQHYIIFMENIVPASDNGDLALRVSDDAGVSYETSGYESQACEFDNGASQTGTQSTSTIVLHMDIGSGTNELMCGEVHLITPEDATVNTTTYSYGVNNNGVLYGNVGGGVYEVQSTINAIQLYFLSGNIESGVFHLYGVKES